MGPACGRTSGASPTPWTRAGRRGSERRGVALPNVHLDQARALVAAEFAKSGRERWIHLSPDMVRRLRALKQASASEYVFAAPGGGPLHRFKHVYFETVRKVGLGDTGLNLHALRHSWASMIEAGADLAVVRDLGGWSDLGVLGRYSHSRPERALDATAKMLAAREAQPKSPHASPRPITAVPRNA